MQPDWKLCPICGTAAEPVGRLAAPATTYWLNGRKTYLLYRQSLAELRQPFEELFQPLMVDAAPKRAQLEQLTNNAFRAATRRGVSAMLDLIGGQREDGLDPHLRAIEEACSDCLEAKRDILAEKIPETGFGRLMAGFTDPTIQTNAAVGGALGSVVPGLGNLMGAIAGGFLGGKEVAQRHATLFERFAECAGQVLAKLDEVHTPLLEILTTVNGAALARPPREIKAALLEWKETLDFVTAESEKESPAAGESEDRLRRCTRLLPEEAQCYEALAYVLEHQGKLAEAIEAVRDALQLEPDMIDGWVHMVTLLVLSSQIAEAGDWMRRAGEYFPDEPEVQKCLAEAYLKCGDAAMARHWAKRALLGAPSEVSLLMTAARACSASGDYDASALHLLDALPLALASIDEWHAAFSEDGIGEALRAAPALYAICPPFDLQKLAEICLGSLMQADAYLGPDAPVQKLQAARETFLKRERSRDGVIWYYDSTVFGSGADGIALTRSGVAWNTISPTQIEFVQYGEIDEVELSADPDVHLLTLTTSDRRSVCFCANRQMAEALFRFLTILRARQNGG